MNTGCGDFSPHFMENNCEAAAVPRQQAHLPMSARSLEQYLLKLIVQLVVIADV